MKKAIIFDLDGTLINSLPDISAAMNRSLEKAGLPAHPEERYKYMVGDGVINLTRRAVGSAQEMTEAMLSTYKADYAAHCHVNTHVYRGIRDALTVLHEAGIKLCVFSNKDQPDTESVIRYYLPDIHFSVLWGRKEGFPIKPDPAGALETVKLLNLSPDDFWYIGDTATDMKCAAAAGMESIGVLWGFRTETELRENGARHIAGTPEEMVDMILHGKL